MIQLNENSQIPIYQQVYDGLLNLIVMQIIREGEKLPSVREFALMLKINPNTIQKAYKALENDGFIESHKGKGNFVTKYESIAEKYKVDLMKKLEVAVKELIQIGESKENIIGYVQRAMEG